MAFVRSNPLAFDISIPLAKYHGRKKKKSTHNKDHMGASL
jgi:hypothetical protein